MVISKSQQETEFIQIIQMKRLNERDTSVDVWLMSRELTMDLKEREQQWEVISTPKAEGTKGRYSITRAY